MSEVSQPKTVDEKRGDGKRKPRNRGRSLFGPIVLIAAGVIFLLANLNLLPEPEWVYALSFWPVLLIFIGLDLLVVQARAPLGTFLSLLVSIAAVSVFSYLLFSGPESAVLRSWGFSRPAVNLEQQSLTVPVGTVESAEIEIDLSNYPADITGLMDSSNLVEGSIWTASGLALDVESDQQKAKVKIGEESGFESFLNPANWFTDSGDHTWRIAISDRLPIDLTINAGNGSATVNLDALTLFQLRLDASNGTLSARMPDGAYEGRIEGANGALQITLPGGGRQELEVDGGNGSMTFLLPAGMEARLEFDEGNGGIAVDERFELVDGDRERGIYETAGYSDSGDGLVINLETGNGSFRITEP